MPIITKKKCKPSLEGFITSCLVLLYLQMSDQFPLFFSLNSPSLSCSVICLCCHLSLSFCLIGFGFNGLWRFAGPFSKVWLTAPINIFLFSSGVQWRNCVLRSLCRFLDLLTKTAFPNISRALPVSQACYSPTVLLWGLRSHKWLRCIAYVSLAEGSVFPLSWLSNNDLFPLALS